ncbi:MAG: type VI secretion system tube protein Hcp [Aquisalimonadaceae bacterium]
MAVFLHYEGITGETSDQNHQGWMDIESWSWGTRRKITSSSSTKNDRESANTEITDLLVSRYMDSATPNLFIESCCGKGNTVVLRLTKTGTGSGSDVYMEYTLKNALISKYDVGGTGQDTRRPIEQLTISFVDLEVKYTPYDDDGNALAPVAVGFDTATNTKR